MRIDRQVVKFSVEDAEFEFERLKQNALLKLQVDLSTSKGEPGVAVHNYWDTIFKRCISVKNLFEGDKELTVTDIQERNLYPEIAQKIHDAYFAEINGNKQNESDPIKQSNESDSQAA